MRRLAALDRAAVEASTGQLPPVAAPRVGGTQIEAGLAKWLAAHGEPATVSVRGRATDGRTVSRDTWFVGVETRW